MTDAASERLLSGQAWDDWCDMLRKAGHMIDAFGDDVNDRDRIEWYRFMTRLVRNGFERFVENGEATRPRLRDTPWRQSINFQSPNQDHLLAEFVDGSLDYRITGNRGTLPYFVICSWRADQPADIGERNWAERGVEGLKEFDPVLLQTTNMIQSDSVEFDADGNFEIIVSQNKPADGKAWLPMTADCVGLLVRTVYDDRANTIPPTMTLERIDGAAPEPINARHMSEALAKSGQVAIGYAELVRSWWQDNLGKRPNRIRFSKAVYLSNGGVPDRHHGFGTWERAEDEALVIRFTPPQSEFWIFQLCNIWQENLDNYEEGQGHVTIATAKPMADGSIMLVIAAEDPGLGGNWVDPYGLVHGGMSLRMIKPNGEPPAVRLHRVKLADLRSKGLEALKAEDEIVSGEITD